MSRSSRTSTIILIAISAAIVSTYLHYQSGYAETQSPILALATQADPYYFSEGGFGIRILKYHGIPLTPYLTPGTTEDSSLEDILNSYYSANEKAGIRPIVDDKDRARYFVVHFWDMSNGPKTLATFGKFQPVITKNPLAPVGNQQYSKGFSLESLTDKNNQWFYNNIINDYINPGNAPHPFNADIDLVTGDGNILQTYQYKKCKVDGYVPFLSENLIILHFTKQLKSEVRDRANFSCDSFLVNLDLRKPSSDWDSIKNTINSVPDQKDLVQKYVVKISSDIFKTGMTFQTFAKFTPMGGQDDIPLSIAANPISGQSKSFSLESLPSKDKEQFYQYVIDKLDNSRQHQPVDVSVDLVTGDGTVLQTWKYPRCDVTNYSAYREELIPIWKFKQSGGPEIRDKTFFSCNGLQVNFIPSNVNSSQTIVRPTVPLDKDRPQVFTVHFSGGDMKTGFNYTFLKFAPFSKRNLSLMLPDYSVGDKPQFYLESVPSKDKTKFYELVNRYVKPGTAPLQFDVSVGLTNGDGSTMQSWDYTNCDVTKYQPYLQNILVVNMFTEKLQQEIRERTIFACAGLLLEGKKETMNLNSSKMTSAVDFVPSTSDRAQIFVVNFSNGDFHRPERFYTFAEFRPDLSASDRVQSSYPQIKSSSFELLSLPSKDKADFYKLISRFVNPEQKPQLFDVSIEVVTGDGSIVQTWQYQKCTISDYKTYLQNTLVYYTMSGQKAISEPQDKTAFQCSGFSIAFEGGKEDLSKQQVIPSDDTRVMTYVTHLTSDIFVSSRTSGLLQEFDTLPNQQFQLESLPNKYNQGGYQLISKYINPGTQPGLFDFTADLITGDGTKLYSVKYPKCSGTDYSIFLDDSILNIKFGPLIKSEIRDKAIVQCSGVNLAIPPTGQSNKVINPEIQKTIGIPNDKIACNQGFQLMVRPPHENTICVKVEHVQDLTQRGWHAATTNQNLSNLIKPIIPTIDEKATSIKVTFQGTDIPTHTIRTFSKFVPISKDSSTKPSYPLTDHTSPLFYLESMPSKDKADLYHLVGMYVNPGQEPNLFDVKVEILNGDNSTLQTWNYVKCQITNYIPYLDENVLLYKYHQKWQAEIKDSTTFSCSGLNFGLG